MCSSFPSIHLTTAGRAAPTAAHHPSRDSCRLNSSVQRFNAQVACQLRFPFVSILHQLLLVVQELLQRVYIAKGQRHIVASTVSWSTAL